MTLDFVLDKLYELIESEPDSPLNTYDDIAKYDALFSCFALSVDDDLVLDINDYTLECKKVAFKVGFETAFRFLMELRSGFNSLQRQDRNIAE